MVTNRLDTSPEALDIVAELREGLNSAYRQLRELITTFRLKMGHARMEDSLGETVREFSQRSGLAIKLDQGGWSCALNPNEQIHVMQIIREALNNAVKYAHAHQLSVRLRIVAGGEAQVEVEDDGVGLPAQPERDQHFGLGIMRERADNLGGVLSQDSAPGQGVRVRLSFRPAAYRNAPTPLAEVRYV
jgi:two-component system nitrate/nitrite sensor histidine kinase NarX